ncbi:MAG: hypothetical protein IPK64_20310 [bacterium]|nr:hypothetical protein [bacterium]
MASTYPGSLDSFDTIASDKKTSDAVGGRTHRDMHNDLGDAIEAVQTELGANPSGSDATVAARLTAIEAGTNLGTNSVGAAQIANDSVDTAAIQDAAVTAAKIADDAHPVSSLRRDSAAAWAARSSIPRQAKIMQDLAAVQSTGKTHRTSGKVGHSWPTTDGKILVQSIELTGSPNGTTRFYDLQRFNSGDTVWPPQSPGPTYSVHQIIDDLGPIALWGSYIGGSHGWRCWKLTIVGHDKTSADLGSQWAGGSGKVYTLAAVVGNVLWFLEPVKSQSGGSFTPDYTGITSGQVMTHSAGAVHTSSVTAAANATSDQLYPTSTGVTVSCETPEGTTDGITPIVITCTYTVPDYKSFIDTAVANVGGTPTAWAAAATPGLVFTDTIERYGPLTLLRRQLTFNTAQFLDYSSGALQAIPLTTPAGGSVKYTAPGFNAKNGLDISAGVLTSAIGTSTTWATSDLVSAGTPLTEMQQQALKSDGTTDLALQMGYCEANTSTAANRLTNSTRHQLYVVSSTKKMYPAYWSSPTVNGAVVAAGTVHNTLAYRYYPLLLPGGVMPT